MITCQYANVQTSVHVFDGVVHHTTIWFDNRFGLSLWEPWSATKYHQFTATQYSALEIEEVQQYLLTH